MAYNLSAAPLKLDELEKIFKEKPLLEISPNLLLPLSPEIDNYNNTANKTAEAFLLSHNIGFGPLVPEEVIRLTLVLQLSAFLLPNQQPINSETFLRLLAFYNREVWPVLYVQGLPTSQLTQLCLPLLGFGAVSFQGYQLKAADVMDIFSWQPLTLSAQEIDFFIKQNSFSFAYLIYNFFRLQPLVNWLEYLIGVFETVAVEQPTFYPTDKNNLKNAVANTHQVIENNLRLPAGKQNLVKVREAVLNLLQNLTTLTAALADLTSETLDHLSSTSEPPATNSYALTADLVHLLQKQIKLTNLNSSDTIILVKELRLLHQACQDAINLTEQLIALAFWSITQVGKVFNLTPGNLTLSAYYHSTFFVPKEMVQDQLIKITDFTRITAPTPIT